MKHCIIQQSCFIQCAILCVSLSVIRIIIILAAPWALTLFDNLTIKWRNAGSCIRGIIFSRSSSTFAPFCISRIEKTIQSTSPQHYAIAWFPREADGPVAGQDDTASARAEEIYFNPVWNGTKLFLRTVLDPFDRNWKKDYDCVEGHCKNHDEKLQLHKCDWSSSAKMLT